MGKNKSRSRPARSGPGWGIQVRLSDGRRSWYFQDDRYRDDGGRSAERWSPYEAQAVRFDDEAEARRAAGRMAVNSDALEYLVVPLSPARSAPVARPRATEGTVDDVGQGA